MALQVNEPFYFDKINWNLQYYVNFLKFLSQDFSTLDFKNIYILSRALFWMGLESMGLTFFIKLFQNLP